MSEGELKKGKIFQFIEDDSQSHFEVVNTVETELLLKILDEVKQDLLSKGNRTFLYWLSDEEVDSEGKFPVRKYICIDSVVFEKWFGTSTAEQEKGAEK